MKNAPAIHATSQRRLARLVAIFFTLSSALPAQAALDIPDTPLQTSVSADPNVMMILDDSGSMQFEIMPDDYTLQSTYFVFPRANNTYGSSDYSNYVVTVDNNNAYNALARSPQVNTIYYNPSITYLPWSRSDGTLYPNATPSCALHNPLRPGAGDAYCRNLTADNSNYNGNFWQACTSLNNCTGRTSVNKQFWPATYFWKASNTTDIWAWNSYSRTEIKAGSTYTGHGRENRTDCTNGVCSYNQEIQNFANWYTYYRSRVLTARAGIGRAFSAQDAGLRVGFGTINKANSNVDGINTSVIVSGVRKFEGTDRDQFFTNLYDRAIPAQGTPLLGALNAAGKYYQRTDDKGPWSTTPGQNGGSDLACRQSYTILMTDGYYGDTIAGIGNADGTNGEAITGPNNQSFTYTAAAPFRDGNSNTLADVAMHYWKQDLRPNMTNSVPTSAKDPAFWQHMVTFGVGLGVRGSVNPNDAFDAIRTGTNINWPSTSTNAGKLDDLLHASVNSRGAFFSAQDPAEFAEALTAMLRDIVERKSSSSSIALTGTRLTASTKVFSPSFNTSGWIGELAAYDLTSAGISTTPAWKASENIPAPGSRKIYTVSGGNKREFTWSNLSATDRTAIGSETILDFLRGIRSQETSQGGTLRTRGSLLGDIVHSSPVYQKDAQTVYVGANDGMLHAFNTETGVERFAYIPSPLLSKLKLLSETSYQHKYYVDGELIIVDKSDANLTSTYLVGTMGAGAKGLFALDITAPASFTANNIAWEYVDNSDTELGYMMGKPVYARLNDGTHALIIGNGYNSTSGKAALYVINLQTGALIKKFVVGAAADTDNGMATPGIVDVNGDGYIDYVYAGDFKGNVWKYDIRATNSGSWTATKFFTAVGPDNKVQPITTQITSAVNYLLNDANSGKRYIFFGTGSYFRAEDTNDKSVQSWYGLIDTDPAATNNAITGRGQLQKRTIATVMTADGRPARAFSNATKDATGKATDMIDKRGWYLDWVDPDPVNSSNNFKLGERVITPSVMYRLAEPTLLGSSVIPEADDPCQPGGTGYVNAINAFTGGSLETSIFVFTNFTGSGAVGSIDLGIGMPSQPSLIIDSKGVGRLVVGGSGGTSTGDPIPADPRVNVGNFGGRVYWREISR